MYFNNLFIHFFSIYNTIYRLALPLTCITVYKTYTVDYSQSTVISIESLACGTPLCSVIPPT